jgi:hypothetical protein
MLEQVDVSDLNSHVLSSLSVHLTTYVKRLTAVEKEVGQRQTTTGGEGNLTSKISDFDSRLKTLEDQIRQQTNRMNTSESTSAIGAVGGASYEASAASGAAAASGDVTNVGDKLLLYEGVITVLGRELERLLKQVTCSH